MSLHNKEPVAFLLLNNYGYFVYKITNILRKVLHIPNLSIQR